MQNCEHCKVQVTGTQKFCPLCGGVIRDNGDKNEDKFPQIPTIFQEFNLFIRIMILVSVSAIIISLAVNGILTKESHWALLVIAGILCMWISMIIILRKKNNIPKTIVWQVLLIGILSVLWDRYIGWIGWSIDYVIPSICVGAMIVMPIAAKMLRIGLRDLLIYLFIDVMFGFIPIIFLLSGWLQVKFPSIICATTSAISLTAIILFEWDNMKEELNKRMHI